MSDRESDCEDASVSEPIRRIALGAFKLRARVPRKELRGVSLADHSIKEMWYRFVDGTGVDVISLGYLTDMVHSLLFLLYAQSNT